MFLVAFVCLFVCVHDYFKSNEQLFLEYFYVGMALLKEEIIKFWKRSQSYSGYEKSPIFKSLIFNVFAITFIFWLTLIQE